MEIAGFIRAIDPSPFTTHALHSYPSSGCVHRQASGLVRNQFITSSRCCSRSGSIRSVGGAGRLRTVDPNYMWLGIFYRHIGQDQRAAEAFERSRLFSDRDQVSIVNYRGYEAEEGER